VANVDPEVQTGDLEDAIVASGVENPLAAEQVGFSIATDDRTAIHDDSGVEQSPALRLDQPHDDHRPAHREAVQYGPKCG